MEIPKMAKAVQTFDDAHIEDIEAAVWREVESTGIRIQQGQSIALAVGSRGIANIDRIVKSTIDWLKEAGAHPFIVPAMGSHGGATAEGQRQVLASYGIKPETMGVPIKSSMEVVRLPQGKLCHPIYMDQYANEADGVVIINRVKVHTDFHGTTESGLLKMCVIGLGKHRQALEMHSFGVYGLRELIPIAARHVLNTGKIVLGIGIVENAYDQTSVIRAVLPDNMEEEEIRLLDLCRRSMPSLPIKQLDVLIVDEMGKDISGTGIDPNIMGRMRIRGIAEPAAPDIANIVVTDLTEASHGNALGMGMADFITKRLRDKIDFPATYENVITSTFTDRGKMPIVADTDRNAVRYALRTCGRRDLEAVRMIRIKNTLRVGEMYVSSSVWEEVQGNKNMRLTGPFREMFDDSGALSAF